MPIMEKILSKSSKEARLTRDSRQTRINTSMANFNTLPVTTTNLRRTSQKQSCHANITASSWSYNHVNINSWKLPHYYNTIEIDITNNNKIWPGQYRWLPSSSLKIPPYHFLTNTKHPLDWFNKPIRTLQSCSNEHQGSLGPFQQTYWNPPVTCNKHQASLGLV